MSDSGGGVDGEVQRWLLKNSYDHINFNCGAPINVVLMRHHKMLLFAHQTMQMDLRERNLHFTSHCSASMVMVTMNDALQIALR